MRAITWGESLALTLFISLGLVLIGPVVALCVVFGPHLLNEAMVEVAGSRYESTVAARGFDEYVTYNYYRKSDTFVDTQLYALVETAELNDEEAGDLDRLLSRQWVVVSVSCTGSRQLKVCEL